jgi:hypothetical protein
LVLLAACGSSTHISDQGVNPPVGGNPGGTPPPGLPNPPPPPAPVTQVTLTGQVTFDRVPFSATAGAGLDYAATTQSPARGITLEVLDSAASTVLFTVQTDATGTYTIPNVPANTVLKLRMRAVMGNVVVRDNTSTDPNFVYEYVGGDFSSGAIEPREQDLNAPSGWDGTAYTQPRSAAPFAILDSIYDAQQFVLTAGTAITLDPITVYWSPQNTATVSTGDFDDDRLTGDIFSSQYVTVDNTDTAFPGIYLLGSANDDTDEYDSDVVVGMWTYHYLASVSRDDTMHGTYEDRLDLRAAYSSGWSFALPLIIKGNSIYRDSSGAGQGTSTDFNAESGVIADKGWYNPNSIGEILWDVVDIADDGVDDVSLPFSALQATLVQDMPNTAADTSIYPFANALSARVPTAATQIMALLNDQNILVGAATLDDFGSLEANNAGDARNLPLYRPLTLGGGNTRIFVTGAADNYYNGLENRRYFRLDLASQQSFTVTAQGTMGFNDPDILVYRNGQLVADGDGPGQTEILPVPNAPAGTYVIEVFESGNVFPDDPNTDTGDAEIDVRVDP